MMKWRKYNAVIFCASKACLEPHSSNYVAQDITKQARKRTSWMRQFVIDAALGFDLQEFRHKGLHGPDNIINRHAIHASVINRTFPEHTG